MRHRLVFGPLALDRLTEHDGHDDDPEADGDVSHPERQQAVPGDGTCQCAAPTNAAGTSSAATTRLKCATQGWKTGRSWRSR